MWLRISSFAAFGVTCPPCPVPVPCSVVPGIGIVGRRIVLGPSPAAEDVGLLAGLASGAGFLAAAADEPTLRMNTR